MVEFESEGQAQTVEARFLLVNFGRNVLAKVAERDLRTGCYG